MSATSDEEHLNHPISFLQPLGMLRSSGPQLVQFCETTHLQKINQQQVALSETMMSCILHCKKDLVVYHWNQNHYNSLLGT